MSYIKTIERDGKTAKVVFDGRLSDEQVADFVMAAVVGGEDRLPTEIERGGENWLRATFPVELPSPCEFWV